VLAGRPEGVPRFHESVAPGEEACVKYNARGVHAAAGGAAPTEEKVVSDEA